MAEGSDRLTYHIPVLVGEVVTGLTADPDGVYLDATAGGGGHSQALLEALGTGARLVAFDRDDEAVRAAGEKLAGDPRASVHKASFAELDSVLDAIGVGSLSGVLFDLGVSSHQIDAAQRGFSYRADGPLDMRMDPGRGMAVADLIASAREEDLARLIRDYGEERQARRIAQSIVQIRAEGPLLTTEDLRQAIVVTHPQMPSKTLARVFQAFRIAVNDELEQLVVGLDAALARLVMGGRLAVIAYHSLEDRIVKHRLAERMRGCICPPRLPVCACGHQPEFAKVGRGRFKPGADEVAKNSRARSATLRLYEKIEEN